MILVLSIDVITHTQLTCLGAYAMCAVATGVVRVPEGIYGYHTARVTLRWKCEPFVLLCETETPEIAPTRWFTFGGFK